MASIGDSSSVGRALGAVIQTANNIGRFIPEPQNTVARAVTGALSGIGSAITGSSGSYPGVDSGYQSYLDAQVAAQQQMLLVSLYSNVEKSRHETQMAAVRNVRPG